MAKRVLHPNHTKVPLNFCRLPDGYGVVKICVSGAAETGLCGLDAYEKAKEVGREIAKHGAIINTGATDVLNDRITLTSDGKGLWITTGLQGVFASEA